MRETITLRGAAAAGLVLVVAHAIFAGPRVPARLLQAREVALGFDLGDRFLSETDAMGMSDRVMPEDRQALRAVRALLEKWGRYSITSRGSRAEILITVRVGRHVDANGSDTVRRRTPPRATSAGVQLSSGVDMLSVYEAADGGLGALLWRAQHVAGFSGPSPALGEQFKTDVEAAARRP